MQPLLDLDQAAELLNVKVGYLRRLVREQRITSYRVGKYVRFKASDLEAWVQERRVEPRP